MPYDAHELLLLAILISEYYGTFLAMKQKLSKYLRTHKSDLDVMNYIEQRSIKFQNF